MAITLSGDVLIRMSRLNRTLPLKERRIVAGLIPPLTCVLNGLDSSYLIGGLPGQGKSTIAAWFACMGVVVGGQLIVVDPHMHHEEESLYARISPLQRWFAGPPVSFDDDEIDAAMQLINWLWEEYNRRRNSPVDLKPLFVIIDEFNELLDDLSNNQLKFALKVFKKLLRGGRKHGIVCILVAQNWDLEATGGRGIRTNTGCKIVTPADISEYKLVLGIDDETAKELPPIRKGLAHVKLLGRIRQLRYPNTTKQSCQAIADMIARREEASHEETAETQPTPSSSPVLALPGPIQRITHPLVALVQQPKPSNQVFEEEMSRTQQQSSALMKTPTGSEPAEKCGLSAAAVSSGVRTADGARRASEPNRGQGRRGEERGALDSRNQAQQAVSAHNSLPFAAVDGNYAWTRFTDNETANKLITWHIQGQTHTEIAAKLHMSGRKYARLYVPMYQSLGIPPKLEDAMTPQEWEYLKFYYGNKCLACGSPEGAAILEPDHVYPRSLGGSDALWNRQPLCQHCNRSKKEKHVDYRK